MKSKEALAKQCNYLFNEFLTNNKKYKTLAHFRRTPGGYLIMLKIFQYYFNDKAVHVEELIRYVPISISSRLSLFSLVDIAVKRNFLIKTGDTDDHRKKLVTPSEIFIKEFRDWLEDFGTK
jgi:transcriptional regulator CtsR